MGQDQDALPLLPFAEFADVLPTVVMTIGVILLLIASTGDPREQKQGKPDL